MGARGGGLSLYLALKGYEVVCSDLEIPGFPVWALHARHGAAGKITYQAVDILAPPYPEAFFDLIIFKSVIHALPQAQLQAQAFQELHRLLRPGGLLLFAENLRASSLHRILRRLFRPRWLLRQRRYPTAAEIRLWCRNFREFHWETWGFVGTMSRQERVSAGLPGWMPPSCPWSPRSGAILFLPVPGNESNLWIRINPNFRRSSPGRFARPARRDGPGVRYS